MTQNLKVWAMQSWKICLYLQIAVDKFDDRVLSHEPSLARQWKSAQNKEWIKDIAFLSAPDGSY